MDSSGYWIQVGLLLLVCGLQRTCGDQNEVTISCNGAMEKSVLQVKTCECPNCGWDVSSRTLDLSTYTAPLDVKFVLNVENQDTHSNVYGQIQPSGSDCTPSESSNWLRFSSSNDQYVVSSSVKSSSKLWMFYYGNSSASDIAPGSNPCVTEAVFLNVKEGVPLSVTGAADDKADSVNRVGLVVGVVVGIAVVIAALGLFWRKRTIWHKLRPLNSSTGSKDSDFASVNDLSDLEAGAPHHYAYKDLSAATHSFNSKYVVGEGGFGTVYKGVLKDTGSPVAIKRLSQYARQGAREFMAEVKIISQLRHRNLVQLLGWCLEKDELILVYEFMPNGDLDDLIYADKPKCDLTWKQRYNILCGVATALVYLHEEWEQRVVHRDVKTSNVMLDSALNARLGDFGLARLSAHSQAPQTTLVAGTLGYLAPEFSLSGKATDKTDVYAFGVVALEVTCARRPLAPDLVLVDWVWDLHKNERLLDAVDPKLDVRSSDDEVQMKAVLQVGLLCAHPDVNARPSMRQVLNVLKGEASIPRVPRSKPVASYFEDMD
ncbi:hypothetical protein AXG93_154s1820 [Marchantia polymorpha subsp. ruderalis]|uniref:Protein kinase domain-containing protein n=1 Tax=Marchantia polymorpha subsp. ruderalis TaxID=1480154 RepID=A0A176VIC3_MARPO|nr:hypothetical protein AXG93_154s1820 [Marchantia polymorpha subsp. ruderalis]